MFMQLAAVGPFCSVTKVLGEWTINEKSLTSESIEYWASDRRITLDYLRSSNRGIEDQYKRAFREAYARADYYEARFMASVDNWKAVKKLLIRNTNSPVYFWLWVLSHWPWMWHFAHNEKIKRWISAKVLRKSKTANWLINRA